MTWTTPAVIIDQLMRRWDRGGILAARLSGECLFPLEIKLKRPSSSDVADRFGQAQDWVGSLTAASRQGRGFGFDLRFQTRRNRVQGTNEVPIAAVVPTETDALRLIGRQAEADRFQALADDTLSRYPTLRDWLIRRSLLALEMVEQWDAVLAVLDWFSAHPRPGVYVRQMDIAGIDTKFVENHRALLTQLLEEILPAAAVDNSAPVGAAGFHQRFGLRSEPPLVRFRLLDRRLDIHGLSDLSLVPDEFASLRLPLRRVFITENRTNGLAFPDHPDAMVVFGLGYGLNRLAGVGWLRDLEVHYWGDIDTHGFGILDRLRVALPGARSMVMDRATLDAHRALWGQEPSDKRYIGEPTQLTLEERSLFEDLRSDRLGSRVRLEQERVGYDWLARTLAKLP